MHVNVRLGATKIVAGILNSPAQQQVTRGRETRINWLEIPELRMTLAWSRAGCVQPCRIYASAGFLPPERLRNYDYAFTGDDQGEESSVPKKLHEHIIVHFTTTQRFIDLFLNSPSPETVT